MRDYSELFSGISVSAKQLKADEANFKSHDAIQNWNKEYMLSRLSNYKELSYNEEASPLMLKMQTPDLLMLGQIVVSPWFVDLVFLNGIVARRLYYQQLDEIEDTSAEIVVNMQIEYANERRMSIQQIGRLDAFI